MPAMHFTVRWPDSSVDVCYSPSTVIEQHLEVGKEYSVEEFTGLARLALQEASDRVALKFGYACSSAQDQSGAIELKAEGFLPDARPVRVEKIEALPVNH
ncbi:MSMEG_0570 family nitrogen starvation response protein [Sodalis sp. RH15]|uniref:MSMEG_0570 family nitrogen starvation response protein n=1 Tax=Sodalis sp. RH15 TaxID=3394330 RepID=UPI0039B69FF1